MLRKTQGGVRRPAKREEGGVAMTVSIGARRAKPCDVPVMLEDPSGEGALGESSFSQRDLSDEPPTDARGSATRDAAFRAIAAARRARFGRYVKVATAVSALICVAAVARTVGSAAAPARPPAAPPVALPVASPADVAAAASAAREKRAAQDALERGEFDTAITAAARSIAYEPRDGATWLLLGDAYERGGRFTEAKKAYRACVDEARSDVDRCVGRLR